GAPADVLTGPVRAHPHEEAEVRCIASPRERHPARAPIAREAQGRGVDRWLDVVRPVYRGAMPGDEAVLPAVVVEPRPSRAGGIHELVIPATTDDQAERSRPIGPAHDRPVVAPMKVHAALIRLASVERPRAGRRCSRTRRESPARAWAGD